jgi:hypothetical protein
MNYCDDKRCVERSENDTTVKLINAGTAKLTTGDLYIQLKENLVNSVLRE